MIKYSTNIWWAVSTEPKPIATVNIGDLLFWKDTIQEFVYQSTNNWVEVIKINNITGGTYNTITNSLTLQEYLGKNVTITGFTGSGGSGTFTGGTIIGPTIFLSGLTATTISATTYQNLPINNFITGGTFNPIYNTLNLVNYTGGTVPITGFTTGSGTVFTGGTVTGPTTFLNGLSANTISATTYQNLPINNFLTGGTFNSGTNTLNLVNYTGGTVSITGFTSGSGGTSNLQYYISGSTPAGTIHSGDRWFDTSSGYELVYINDGNSSQWVQPNANGQVTIYNVSGGTSTSGNYLSLSGGTVTGGTIFTAGLSANTISATTYSNLPIDITITGGTYSAGTATFTNNTGGTFSVTGFSTGSSVTQGITGVTGNNGLSASTAGNVTTIGFSGGTIRNTVNFTNGLTANTISATTYQNLPVDIKVTGGTYSAGTATFTNNTGGTFSVTGFSTGSSVTQGVTGITGNNGLSASTTNNVTTIGFSGGTIPNSTNFTGGLSANTISATTYQNLPTDIRTTGATYSNNTFTFTNNTGGTYSVLFNTVTGLTINGGLTVTGNTSLQGLTATTISATTYVNLPTDIRTTGATYSNNTFTFTNNTGGTYSVLFNTVTGLTINGNLTVTGNTSLQGLTATTISATSYSNLTAAGSDTQVQFNKSGVFSGNSTFSWDYTNSNLNIGQSNSLQSSQYSHTIGPNGSTLSGTTYSVIVAGNSNSIKRVNASTNTNYNAIIAGLSNTIYDTTTFSNVQYNFIGAGNTNTIINGASNAIIAGSTNVNRSGGFSAIIGGQNNDTGTNANVIILGGVGITGTTASTTYLENLNIHTVPTNDNTLTQVLVRDGSTGDVKYRSVNTLFTGGTVTGMTINGNNTTTGTTFLGNGTFTKSGYNTGDILLDNNGTDTPGILFYYANNSNYGIDSWNGSYDVLSGQLFRVTNKLNESGGAVKMAVDTSGNLVMSGFIKANAWRAGQIIQTLLYNNTDLGFNANYTNSTNTYTSIVSGTYTPLSSSSYIFFEVYAMYEVGGAAADSFFSQITWNGNEVGVQRQVWANGAGGGTRSGTLFPLAGRVTNSSTTGYGWAVNTRRDSSDDGITVIANAGFYVKITEIAR
jgi:hypothetical protein